MKTFITFKKIALGGPKPKLKGINISSYAEEILKQVTYQKRKEYAELVVVKVDDMGLPSTYPTTSQIYAWAKENGLELCPAEIGPRLREAYTDQPKGEGLVIAMEPLLDSDGNPCVFGVNRDGTEPWLDRDWAGQDTAWAPEDRFVFRKSLAVRSSALHSEPEHFEFPDVLIINDVEYRKVV